MQVDRNSAIMFCESEVKVVYENRGVLSNASVLLNARFCGCMEPMSLSCTSHGFVLGLCHLRQLVIFAMCLSSTAYLLDYLLALRVRNA